MSEFLVYDNGNHMVSQSGIVKNVWGDIIEPYISSSNMLYVPYTFEGNITRLKRLDLIVACMFNQVPDELLELPLVGNVKGSDIPEPEVYTYWKSRKRSYKVYI